MKAGAILVDEATWGSCMGSAMVRLDKPKFHYADFATKFGTSSQQSCGLIADTNHESPRHK